VPSGRWSSVKCAAHRRSRSLTASWSSTTASLSSARRRAPQIHGICLGASYCLAWSSAPRHLGARDRFIGWSAQARRRNLRFLAYNPRFLILPWILVKHLASHILGQMARRIAGDWELRGSAEFRFSETLRSFLHLTLRPASIIRLDVTLAPAVPFRPLLLRDLQSAAGHASGCPKRTSLCWPTRSNRVARSTTFC